MLLRAYRPESEQHEDDRKTRRKGWWERGDRGPEGGQEADWGSEICPLHFPCSRESPNLFSDLLPSFVKRDYFMLSARAGKRGCGGAQM